MIYPFILTPLPYAYDALEPYIDEATMRLHHDRHQRAYVEGLNQALAGCSRLQHLELTELLCAAERYPERLRTPILRNAGGVFNHEFYFAGLSPDALQRPTGALRQALERDFGCLEHFHQQLLQAALGVFGSGYAWLALCGGRLRILTTPNQTTPLPQGIAPLLNIDVWEHAYYLKYQNRRKDYLEALTSVISWPTVQARYDACLTASS